MVVPQRTALLIRSAISLWKGTFYQPGQTGIFQHPAFRQADSYCCLLSDDGRSSRPTDGLTQANEHFNSATAPIKDIRRRPPPVRLADHYNRRRPERKIRLLV